MAKKYKHYKKSTIPSLKVDELEQDHWCMEFEDGKISAKCSVQCPFCERGL